jgi:uncharacterized membrane-anchored protein YitT (DUF2179 family)
MLFNLSLISIGCIIFVIGMKSVLIPTKLLSGGIVGVAMILHYLFPSFEVGLSYFLLNIPLILLGCFNISRRFMLYTIFGMGFFSLTATLITPMAVEIQEPMLAALLAGVICGTGGGIILRSLGSVGGLDILAIYVNKEFGFRSGSVIFLANALILLAGVYFFSLEIALYSIIYVFTSSRIIDSILAGFNRRKSLIIISDHSNEIARQIYGRINRGITFLRGVGGYTGKEKNVILTVTTLTELPKMKELVFDTDPDAFMVINDTLEVLGRRHGRRKIY